MFLLLRYLEAAGLRKRVFSVSLTSYLLVLSISILLPKIPASLLYHHYVQSTYVRDDGSAVYIGNNFIEVGFRKETGALWSIVHKSSGVDLRGLKSDPGESLWDLQLLTTDLERIGSSGIRRSNSYYKGYSINQSTSEVEIALEWNKIWLENYGEYPAKVLASVKVSENSRSANFSLKIENSGLAAVEEVCYPFIWEISKLGIDASDDFLVVPDENGRLFHNPSENLNWWGQAYPSGFCTMQFMAYYDTHAGFYFATYDRDANAKFFSWWRSDDLGVWIGISHYPTINFSSSFTLSYDIVLEAFDGDWYSAADIYKNWAHKQWWTLKNSQTSTWLQEMAVGKDFCCYDIQNRTFEECIQKIKQHQEYFNLSTLLCLWGWERGGVWSSGDYFPPREGWNEFDRLVQEAHNSNTRVWVFIDALGIITDSEPWKNETAKPNAVVDENGSYIITPFNGWQHVFICHFTEYWQNTLGEYILTLARHGVDMIQFDGFPWCPPDLNVYASGRSCYNASHGHPLGYGGSWYAKTWFEFLNLIRHESRTINPELVFGGEGGAEIFMPVLDVYHSRDSWSEGFDSSIQNGISSVIPLFNYVYHNYTFFVGEHNLGLFEFLEGHSYNGLGFARILTWGEIPSYNMQESLYDPYADTILINYVKKIGYARTNYAHKFLSRSIPIKPGKIDSPTTLVRIEDGQFFNVSALQYSAWRSDEGSIGYTLTNIANATIEIEGQIDVIHPTPYLAYLVRDGELQWSSLSTNETFNFSIAIEPLEIILLAFTTPVHDMAIVNVIPSSSEVTQGQVVNITVTVRNNGNFTETFNVTAYASHQTLELIVTIQNQTITNLQPFNETILTFSWNTTDMALGNYTISVEISMVPGETYIADNVKVNGTVSVIPEFASTVLLFAVFLVATTTAIFLRKRNQEL